MSECSCSTWPEQDAVYRWCKKHGVELGHKEKRELAEECTTHRLAAQREAAKMGDKANKLRESHTTLSKLETKHYYRADKAESLLSLAVEGLGAASLQQAIMQGAEDMETFNTVHQARIIRLGRVITETLSKLSPGGEPKNKVE